MPGLSVAGRLKTPAIRKDDKAGKGRADPSRHVPSTSWTLPQARLAVDLGGPVSPAPLKTRGKAKARDSARDDRFQ